MKPAKPQHIEQYAAACLEALAGQALGDKISLGGAFGLSYYLEYRPTHDGASSLRTWFRGRFLHGLVD